MNAKHNITKKEAVRKALAKFGEDAKPAQMQPWIKSEFGIDMTPEHITTSKGEILRKGKPAAAPAAAKTTAPEAAAPKPERAPAASKAAAGTGVSLQDLGAVKHLVGRLGADQLRTLIDLFAR